MFTNEELDLLSAALEQLDVYHSNLARSVPILVQSGNLEEARGRGFLLLSKIRKLKLKPAPPVAVE